MADTRSFACKRIHGSPTLLGVSCRPAGFHLMMACESGFGTCDRQHAATLIGTGMEGQVRSRVGIPKIQTPCLR